MNIYIKLVILCLAMVLFTGGAIYFFVDDESKVTVERQISARIDKQASFAIYNIDRFFYERLIDIKQLARDPVLTDASITENELGGRIKEIKADHAMYSSISFYDIARLCLADSEDKNVGKIHPLNSYWKDIDQGEKEVTLALSTAQTGEPIMNFAGVVRNDVGERIGTIVTKAKISWINNLFEESMETDSLMKRSEIDLLDKNGTILYSTTNPNGVLKEKFHDLELLNYFTEHQQENNHLFGDKIYFFTRSKGYHGYTGNNWTLIIGIPSDVAYQPVYGLRNQIAFTLGVVILLAAILAFIAARVFVKPIIKLTASAKEVGEGNLDALPEIRSSDEIGKLAESLTNMAHKLKTKMEEQDKLNGELADINDRIEAKYVEINEQKIEIELAKDQIEMQNDALGEAFAEIEKQNHAITSSIHYAERIQRSSLPDRAIFNQFFPESFVLYKPRDIVSGDFYWFDEILKDGRRYLILAIGDCTGHGVPGGFMSMLGNNLLTTIVSIGGQIDPSKILEEIDYDIRRVLHQDEHSENSQDGMEIALCTIDLETLQMKYSGANRPLYFFRNGEFIEIKADRASLGGVSRFRKKHLENLHLTVHNVQLEEGDSFYLFSDGYKDQFGGENGRIFTTKKFKNLLYQIHQKPMSVQNEVLNKEIVKWAAMSEQKQTDDIIVFGVKVNKVDLTQSFV